MQYNNNNTTYQHSMMWTAASPHKYQLLHQQPTSCNEGYILLDASSSSSSPSSAPSSLSSQSTIQSIDEEIQLDPFYHLNQTIHENQTSPEYQPAKIDEVCTDPPQKYTIPTKPARIRSKPSTLSEEYPEMLRGYMSTSIYVEIVSKLNQLREEMRAKGMTSKQHLAYAAVGFIFIVPIGILYYKYIRAYQNQLKLSAELNKYLTRINSYSQTVKWHINKKVINPTDASNFGITILVKPSKQVTSHLMDKPYVK